MDRSLGLVSCYFNPCGFNRRRDNYFRFHEGMGEDAQHLVTVEAVFDDSIPHMAGLDNHIIRRTPTMLWQKEALLNIGIQRCLDLGYENIAWLDGDILFLNPGWMDNIREAVSRHKFVQVFQTLKRYYTEDSYEVIKSVASSAGNSSPATGFGWAVPSHVYRRVLLYDKLIVGGGDSLIYEAANDAMATWLEKRYSTYRHAEDVFDWANQWWDEIQGDIGYASNNIETFYHGNLKNRRYLNRYDILKKSGFDPKKDVVTDPVNGTIEWTHTRKPYLKSSIREYFSDRKEDD
jgi:hypothetical protein